LKEPTEKQLARIEKIIAHLGREKVIQFLTGYFPSATLENMTRVQAQKLITGTEAYMPKPVIYGIRAPWHYHQD
jgi:hypothetical protein